MSISEDTIHNPSQMFKFLTKILNQTIQLTNYNNENDSIPTTVEENDWKYLLDDNPDDKITLDEILKDLAEIT